MGRKGGNTLRVILYVSAQVSEEEVVLISPEKRISQAIMEEGRKEIMVNEERKERREIGFLLGR